MELHIHIHNPDVEVKIDKVIKKLETIVNKVDELKAELTAANEVTNEIAVDVQDLLNKLVVGGLTAAEADEVKAQIVTLTARLRAVASQHSTEPVDPNVPVVEG